MPQLNMFGYEDWYSSEKKLNIVALYERSFEVLLTKWGPKTIKTNVRENLEQLLGALMTTLTINNTTNQWHFYSEENFIEQHTKSKKDWWHFKGCLELSPTGVKLIYIISILIKSFNDPPESWQKDSAFVMYLHAFIVVFLCHL